MMSRGAAAPLRLAAIIMVAFVLIFGCTSGPNYVRPEATTIPADYKYASDEWKIATPNANLPKGNWWEIFGEPQLNRLEAEAGISNQSLKALAGRFEQARAEADVAFSGLFPKAGVGVVGGAQHDSQNRPNPSTGNAFGSSYTYPNFSLPFNVSWELDLWGGVRRQVESARAAMEAQSDDLQNARLSVAAEVAADYFSIRTLDADKALLLKSIDVFRKSLELVRNRRAGGLVSDLDVAQAETVLKTAEAEVPANELQRARFQDALAVLIGMNPSEFNSAEEPIETEPPTIPAGVSSELLERRPDIASAERRMAAANAAIGVAQAAFFPSITLSATGGVQSISLATLFSGGSLLWAIGASLSQPLFEGGKLRARLSEAKAGYDETVANYRQTVLSAFADVEDNLAAQELLKRQYDEEKSALQSADRQLQIADNQYRAGLVTYLNVANAAVTQLNLQRALASLSNERFITAVTLVKSLGGSWR